MYKKAYSLGLVGLSCVLSFSAQANNFNYNFFEVRTAISPESSGAEFSTYLTDNTHLVARYDSRFDGDWDAAGGIGFNGPINQFADVYGQMLVHHIRPTDEQGGKSETHCWSLILAAGSGYRAKLKPILNWVRTMNTRYFALDYVFTLPNNYR